VRLDGAKRMDSRCPVARAWSSGRPELRGRDAAGMEISGALELVAGVLSSRRMKPVSSVLAMSTAAASAAIAFSTCERRLGQVGIRVRACWKLFTVGDALSHNTQLGAGLTGELRFTPTRNMFYSCTRRVVTNYSKHDA